MGALASQIAEIPTQTVDPGPVNQVGGPSLNGTPVGDVADAHPESIPSESSLHPAHVESLTRVKGPWLRNGNRPGNPANAPRCGAKARTRGGAPCRNAAMRNGRCRMHGGRSTGARTPEGQERARLANMRHGRRSQQTIEARRAVRAEVRRIQAELQQIEREVRQRDRQQRREQERQSEAQPYVIVLPGNR
jgi:hypothetical protein